MTRPLCPVSVPQLPRSIRICEYLSSRTAFELFFFFLHVLCMCRSRTFLMFDSQYKSKAKGRGSVSHLLPCTCHAYLFALPWPACVCCHSHTQSCSICWHTGTMSGWSKMTASLEKSWKRPRAIWLGRGPRHQPKLWCDYDRDNCGQSSI